MIDADKGAPIEGARVFARGVEAEALTGADGTFRLEAPSGAPLDVAIVHPSYAAARRGGVVARPGGGEELVVELVSAASMGEEFVVYIPRIEGATSSLLEERKEAATLNEVIGAEQFGASGDSSAAAALKRVTGLTVVGGRYVYVRGLGDRYSSTLLNGSTLPSPEPERRVVPLDLFPTALLESVTIQKTYSPDRPGEFGGGVVALQTRTFPSEFQASLSVGAGYRQGATLSEAESFEGGSWDWLGFDDGTRALPARVARAGERGPIRLGNSLSGGLEAGELEELGEAMPKTWGLELARAMPDWGGSAAIGNSWRSLGSTWGARLSATLSSGAERVPETFSFLRFRLGRRSALGARRVRLRRAQPQHHRRRDRGTRVEARRGARGHADLDAQPRERRHRARLHRIQS